MYRSVNHATRQAATRLGILLGSLALCTAALAAGHNQLDKPPQSADRELSAEIDAFLNEYEALWDVQEPAGLIALWDQDDPEPFYLAEEQDSWRIGWDQLKNYWDPPGRSTTEALRMRFDTVNARYLTEDKDLAFASFWIRFDTKMIFMPKPIGTDARASAIFRRKPEGWRLITWAESPQSPILYMQKLYEMRMRADFPEYMEEVKARKQQSKADSR